MKKNKVTMQDVAALANVSLTTVSRLINHNGYVAQEKKEEIMNAIQTLGYKIKPVQTVEKRPKIIGLILRRLEHNSFNPFFEKLNSSLALAADQYHYHTISIFCSQLTNESLYRSVKQLYEYGVNGIVIGGFDGDFISDELREFLVASDISVVFVEQTDGCDGFNRVEVNTVVGMVSTVRYLVNKGHRNILYLGRLTKNATPSKRLNGFLKGIEIHGTPDLHYLIKEYNHYNADPLTGNYELTKKAFEEMPNITAIVAWSDTFAAGAMQYLYQSGRRIPENVEVIGHDDLLAPLYSPPISSIRMPIEEMADAAIKLISENEGKHAETIARSIYLDTILKIR